MGNAKAKTIVASLLLAGSALWLYLCLHKTPPQSEDKVHDAVGRVMAEEAARLVGASGGVTLLARDTTVCPNPATDSQMKGFFAAARKLKLPLTATNWIKLDPLRPVRMPPGDFADILRKLNEGDAVVSFVGPPLLTAAQRAKLGDRKVRILALCSGAMPQQVDLRSLFEQNLLHAAVISLPAPRRGPPPSDDAQAWFQLSFQLITPANLAELPAPVPARGP